MNKETFELFLVEAITDQRLQRAIYPVSTVQQAYDSFMSELNDPKDIQRIKSLSIKKGIVSMDIFK
ncbi:hypothetical protein WD019_06490 [Fictibacillus sp. Mic-4]|uniref:hypothetical protein n=1 Tax=Fictibacillus TaxID=1329200 RepID=UPI00040E7CE1|nr:hypothetical protein [Fictibacillus gelatini]